ncbi:membrane protein [Oceaniferula spumae]|uniref:Membrane protein n=1 Tax=Oceaniferula spumae TaxID=2979115 RepID=A0AAT9FQ72_9BACT
MASVGNDVVGSKKRLTLYEQLESGGLASLASMEGAWGDWAEESKAKPAASPLWSGVLISLAVTAIAWLVHRLPFPPFTIQGAVLEHPIGVSILAILLGITLTNVMPMTSLRAGCKWITAWCIPVAVIFLGAGMELALLAGIGWGLLGIIVSVMILAGIVAWGVGRALGMNGRSAYLLGVGTAVCGSSAILATSPVTGADDEDVVLTVGVVNIVGLLAMFACVAALSFVALPAEIYGAWAGASIHAVPQVVAAGESHGADAAAMATLVKLTRVTLLAPVVLLTALVVSSRGKKSQASKKREPLWRYVPWFVWGFILLAAIRALGWLPVLEFAPNEHGVVRVPLSQFFPDMAKWLLAISMAAIGLQVQLKPMLQAGVKAMTAGVITWLVMSASALLALKYLI